MKKALIAILAIGLLSMGAVAFAGWGGPGGSGWGPGACAGPGGGYGPGWGSGACGGPGWGGGPAAEYDTEESKKFFDETAEIRSALHEKMFEYREAYRTGDEEKLEKLDKEITELREKLYDRAKDAGFTGFQGQNDRRGFGPGPRWGGPRGGGYGWGPGRCGGPYSSR